ncbi:Signal transduction histidine kinase [Burkholderiales bacterium 8X]|nr:Signal transduction histidine kinase [Burkholderiales bacterium 8X]
MDDGAGRLHKATGSPGDRSKARAGGKAGRSLAEREADIRRREAELDAAEKRLDDLREANANLVNAALAAEQLEEIARKTHRQQNEFIAMLAHELRNPLAPIRSAASLLSRLDTDDPRLETIGKVVGRQVAHMASLLDDLLDVSRITSGKVSLQRRPVDIREFIDLAVETNRALIDNQQQKLKLEIPATPIHVDGDPTRLGQIIGNLLHNAAKYTPAGGSIGLAAWVEGDWVKLRVVDDGIGISQASLAGIFDLFVQEERSLSRSQGGLGLGLAVVRKMVELHGGTISARSDGTGCGTEFTVSLPRIDYLPESEHPAQEAAFRPARVLVVDDNQDAVTMLSMLLEVSGYQVDVAADGPSALASFENFRPEVVVCDIGLPGMNGYQVAERIREGGDEGEGETSDSHAPAASTRRTLLLALTGYDSPADRARAMAAGFDKHFAKPADFGEMLRLIRNHLASNSGQAKIR